jgi:beta-phosphoglucomutase
MDRGVIFDVDGVLVDSYAAHLASWQAALRERGLDLSEKDFQRTFGRTSREILRELFADHVRDADVPALDDRKEMLYRDILARSFPAMDGAVELIDALAAAGFRLAAGSSAPPANVDLTLDRIGRRDAFAAVVTGRDVTRGKPDPQVFLLAAERLGLAPATCAVVEDAPPGVRAARAAGMTSIALVGTADEGTLRAAGADLTVGSLRELSPERLASVLRGGGPRR